MTHIVFLVLTITIKKAVLLKNKKSFSITITAIIVDIVGPRGT